MRNFKLAAYLFTVCCAGIVKGADGAETPYMAAARARFLERFPGAEIQQVKERLLSDLNVMNFITLAPQARARVICEVKARDGHNSSMKAQFDSTGRLEKLSESKVPLERVPAAVRKSAEKKHPGTTWEALALVNKYEKTPVLWEMKGRTESKKKVEVCLTEEGAPWTGE